MSRLGDLDGDGVTELAMGASMDDSQALNAGALWVLVGRRSRGGVVTVVLSVYARCARARSRGLGLLGTKVGRRGSFTPSLSPSR